MSAVDTTQLDLMLAELRLPTVKAIWPKLAERADAARPTAVKPIFRQCGVVLKVRRDDDPANPGCWDAPYSRPSGLNGFCMFFLRRCRHIDATLRK